MVRTLALISAAAVTGAFAQGNNASTSVVTLTLPEFAPKTIHGSVISVTNGATAYSLGCPSSVKSDNCTFPGFTAVEGPGTLSWEINMTSETVHVECKVTTDVGTCTQSPAFGPGASGQVSGVETTVISTINTFATAVTITAGLEKLAQQTGSPTTTTNRPTGDDGSKTTATSASSTGGVPRNTQQALLAGVAALAGGAILF
ncbi:hypothetical protein V8F33_002112 [Rhypophila sp. PSN 637]